MIDSILMFIENYAAVVLIVIVLVIGIKIYNWLRFLTMTDNIQRMEKTLKDMTHQLEDIKKLLYVSNQLQGMQVQETENKNGNAPN